MLQPQTPAPPMEGNLEDRLRGLILNNAVTNTNTALSSAQEIPSQASLPPHLMMASMEDQQAYFARAATAQPPPQAAHQGQQPQNSRKRLNQSQRRQMNSQLSIPIDTRPQQNAQSLRGYANAQQGLQYRGGTAQPQYDQRFQPSPQSQQPGPPYSPYSTHQPSGQSSPRAHFTHGNQQFQSRQSQPQYPQQQYQAANFESPGSFNRPHPQNRQLFQPGNSAGQGRGRAYLRHDSNDIAAQSNYLEVLCRDVVPKVGIDIKEESEKESFRVVVEQACREAIAEFEQQVVGNAKFDPQSVELKCFGSMSSGFATKASDMDLALLTPCSRPAPDSPESCIPRILEKKLLDAGYGARLLTRTRVPIIKLCERPTNKLRKDLMEERTKWESGFTGNDDERAKSPTTDTIADEPDEEKSLKSPTTSARTSDPKCDVLQGNVDLVQLKQKVSQSLADYYNDAKRLLRKKGVLDLSANSPQHDLHESVVLNSVCKQFISGLKSEALSMRLRTYKSISPLFQEPPSVIRRSLSGIWTQIEGERLAMSYDNRSLTEADEKRENQCYALVEAWRRLQDQFQPLDDPLTYNRQLYMAYERLKTMSSLALEHLREIPHEQVNYYAARAQRLMDDLKQRSSTNADTVTPIFIAHYISGIRNPRIQEGMRDLSCPEQTLKDVVLRHKALQLALDFEHGLQKNLFAATDQFYVDQYISFLRRCKSSSESLNIDDGLLVAVRRLPDPTQISLTKARDRYRDHLEFPKTDIGIQCDINFSAHLALHNTLLLRCYSYSDYRVRILILFVKNWAKVRAINTPYRGTLSSYGYVLMVLHYLVNIAFPFVCPNLQELRKEPPGYLPPDEIAARSMCKDRDVRFWRNEAEIKDLANRGLLNQNKDSAGFLLRGFFEYFAQNTQMSTVQSRGFDWGREVLSLRTHGGIVTKQEKGWTGAKTVFEKTTIAAPPTSSNQTITGDSPNNSADAVIEQDMDANASKPPVATIETKEIRHRYLFAIEDPFELDHNVARTVTHNGIVSIRDEFRRAWRIITAVGKGRDNERLLDPVASESESQNGLSELLDLLHGTVAKVETASASAMYNITGFKV